MNSSIIMNIFASLQFRNFRYFAVGQSVGLVGMWMQRTALVWLVYVLTDSPLMVGLISICQFLPMLLFTMLAGVIVGVVLGAITSLLLLLSPDSLQAMQAFMLGSTGFVGWSACLLMASVWLVCLVLAWVLSRALDGLALGEATAHSLGLPLAPLRAALVAVLALATGTAVAQTGLIAFVGLAAPHLVRAAVSVPHGRLMLLSSLMGGALLCAADLLARGLMAPQELPVGVLTAVLGGGYLLWLMHRRSSPGGLL